MCLFFAVLLMFTGGLYTLITGQVRLTTNLRLTGGRARIAGLFLAAPMPCNLILGSLAQLFARSQADIFIVSLAELAVVLLALITVLIFGRLAGAKPS